MSEQDDELDYSQTHLEDFLKSQLNQSTRGNANNASGTNKHISTTNVQSGQLLNSFLSTYNKMKGGTGTGGNQSARKDSHVDSQMNIIMEKEEDSAGQGDELKRRAEEEEDDCMDRTDE